MFLRRNLVASHCPMGVLPCRVILQCLILCLHGNSSKYVKMAGSSLKGFGQGVQGKVAEPSIIFCTPSTRTRVMISLEGIEMPAKPLEKGGEMASALFRIRQWLASHEQPCLPDSIRPSSNNCACSDEALLRP